jgi:hypothetical protein
MADDKPVKRQRPEADPEIAAADLLFRDQPKAKSPERKPRAEAAAGAGEVFDLAGGPEPDEPEPSAPVAAGPGGPAQAAARGPKAAKSKRVEDESQLDPADLVEEVWTRKGEWGLNLIILGAWLALVFGATYMALVGLEQWGMAFVILLGGLAVAVVLAYPIFITLERPVRMTPEQAVRDYYQALSHHVPHLRRMWLLLSTAGHTSTAYGSFEGFKAYWKEKLTTLRAGHAGSFTPLFFEVVDFNADKSAGKVKVDADFVLKIYVRGKRQEGPINSIPMRIGLARGPDKMWYLENGTLNRDRTGSKARE